MRGPAGDGGRQAGRHAWARPPTAAGLRCCGSTASPTRSPPARRSTAGGIAFARSSRTGRVCVPGRGEGCANERTRSLASRRPRRAAPGRSIDPLYVAYHDEEWGVPEYDDRALYRKADARRLPGRAVVDHHPAQARQFPPRLRRFRAGEDRALHAEEDRAADAGRRHRAQPRQDRRRGALGARLSRRSWRRARAFRSCCGISRRQAEGQHVPHASSRCRPRPSCRGRFPRSWPARGFKFVGPTIVYAFMQAVGMVNDHLVTCHRHAACAKLGEAHEQRSGKRRKSPQPHARRAPGSACCRAAGSICSTPPRSMSRSRTSRTGSRAWRAGTARPRARTFSRSRSTRCWSRRWRARKCRGSIARSRLAVLLHDAPEYVIGDMISPFKAVIGDSYKAVEARLLAAIHLRFGLPAMLPRRARRADQGRRPRRGLSRSDAACRLRGRRGAQVSSAAPPKFSAVIERDYLTPWPAETAEPRYLERFAELLASDAMLPCNNRDVGHDEHIISKKTARGPMIHVCSLARLHETVARYRRAPRRHAAQAYRPGAAAESHRWPTTI